MTKFTLQAIVRHLLAQGVAQSHIITRPMQT
jgi:hypothetical protein